MRYYKQISGDYIFAIGTGTGGTEITESEYNALLIEIREKAALVDGLYSGEITLSDVPEEWRKEIQRRANDRIAADEEAAQQDISADEALNIILGGDAT